MHSTRRQVLQGAGLFGAIFLSRGLIACAVPARSEETGAGGEALTSCGEPVIGRNHGHKLAIPVEDVESKIEQTYSIKGAASHDHTVTLTTTDLATLAATGQITVQSTTDFGHSHPITVTCTGRTPGGRADAGTDPDAAPPVCPNGATATAISSNHGHTLVVPTADVVAGIDKVYSIKGNASHPHDVTITAAHFATLASGAVIEVTSTRVGNHTHVVKVICA